MDLISQVCSLLVAKEEENNLTRIRRVNESIKNEMENLSEITSLNRAWYCNGKKLCHRVTELIQNIMKKQNELNNIINSIDHIDKQVYGINRMMVDIIIEGYLRDSDLMYVKNMCFNIFKYEGYWILKKNKQYLFVLESDNFNDIQYACAKMNIICNKYKGCLIKDIQDLLKSKQPQVITKKVSKEWRLKIDEIMDRNRSIYEKN